MMKRSFSGILPEELIAEILLRLPVKSVISFKCVCKSWLDLISDPQFAKSHFDLMLVPPTHRVLMRSLDDDSKVNAIDVDAPLSKFSAQAQFNIPPPKHGCLVGIVGSCRGFILLTNYAYIDQVFDFVVWNPSTGLYKQINNVERSMQHDYLYGIGYDSSTDDYAVVAVKLPRIQKSGELGTEVYCFSLRTNSWCYTKSTDSHYHLGSRFTNGVLLNGVLHWLVKSHDNICIIIAFDVMEKRLSEIPVPHDAAVELESETYHLRVMGGHLCLYLMGARSEILVMKEYKVQSSWTRSFLLFSNLFYRPHLFFRICFPEDDQGELLELHTDGNEMEISGVVDSVMYRESLLSLPGPKKPARPSLREL